MKRILLLTSCVALCLAAPAFADEGGKRIAVVPFAALSGDVPQRAGNKAAGMLQSELKNSDAFALVQVKEQGGQDPYKEKLDAARAKVKEAQELRSKRKFRAAEAALTEALEAYRANAAGLTDIGELQDAYVLLSAIQYNTGRDEEGAKTLDTALALSPSRELPLAKTSPLFTKVVSDAREKLLKGPKGQLYVDSAPQGAAVVVDGAALGAAPVLVTDVPPGLHVWRVQLPSGEVAGGVVQVTAQKQARVQGASAAADPESKMLSALSTNRLDKAVVEAARQTAREANAEMVIFGALSRDGKNLVLDSFVVEAASGKVKRLPASTFDPELLSAGMEFYNLVGRLAKDGLAAGKDTPVPVAVSERMKGATAKVVEVQYGKSDEKPSLPGVDEAPPKKDEKRTPLEPKKKRAPLRR